MIFKMKKNKKVGLIECKNNIISINLNLLNSIENKDLVCLNLVISHFLYAIISFYTKTHKS